MALLNYASAAQTHLQWKSLIFHAARPVYTDAVFSKPLKTWSMCLLQESSQSSRYYWLYSSTQGIVRTGKCYPNHYTYRVKGIPRGKNRSLLKKPSMCLLQKSSQSSRYYWLYSSTQGIVRTGKHYPNHYTYRVKGTPRGTFHKQLQVWCTPRWIKNS